MARIVKRTIYFYRIDQVEEETVSLKTKLNALIDLPSDIRERPIAGNKINLKAQKNGDIYQGHIDLLREETPIIRKAGTFNTRSVSLANDEGVNEVAHFVFEPSQQVIAMEYNHFGPRIGLLMRYINETYQEEIDKSAKDNTYTYIIKTNSLERIENSYGIRVIQLGVADGSLSGIAPQDTNISKGLRAFLQATNAKNLEFTLKGPKNERKIIMWPKEFFATILPNKARDLENFDKLKVRIQTSPTGGVEGIDLLADKMTKEIAVMSSTNNSRTIDSNVCLEKIHDSLKELFK